MAEQDNARASHEARQSHSRTTGPRGSALGAALRRYLEAESYRERESERDTGGGEERADEAAPYSSQRPEGRD